MGKVLVLIQPGPLALPCRIWQGATSLGGYPLRGVDGKKIRVHREVYENAHGPIPPGFDVHHLCGHRRCIEEAHLEAVDLHEHRSRHQNGVFAPAVADALAKSRRIPDGALVDGRKVLSETCKRGHPWTPENTLTHPNQRGRQCKTCRRIRARARTEAGRQ